MRTKNLRTVVSWFSVMFFATGAGGAMTPNDSVMIRAKQEAEAKGYIFAASHEEIVARAKKEGKLRATSSLGDEARKAMWDAFRAEYPFLVIQVDDLGGEAAERWLLELKAGLAKGWDANHIPDQLYVNNELALYQKKFDILGLA